MYLSDAEKNLLTRHRGARVQQALESNRYWQQKALRRRRMRRRFRPSEIRGARFYALGEYDGLGKFRLKSVFRHVAQTVKAAVKAPVQVIKAVAKGDIKGAFKAALVPVKLSLQPVKKVMRVVKKYPILAVVAAVVASIFIPGVGAVMMKGLTAIKAGAISVGKALIVSKVAGAARAKGVPPEIADSVADQAANFAEETGLAPSDTDMERFAMMAIKANEQFSGIQRHESEYAISDSQRGEIQQMMNTQAAAESKPGLPGWVVPAAVGAGALMLLS